jgi:hypothetical protein
VSKILTIGVAAALAAGSVLAAAPAQAATARNHIVAIDGSDGYLVYKVAKSTKDIEAHDRSTAKVYVRDVHGKVTALPHFTDGVGVIQQTGHSLVEKTFTNVTVDGNDITVERVRQRDLRTGAESQVTLAPFDSLESVAPDGYIVRHNDGGGDGASDAGITTLTYHHLDGSTSTIAVPFADHTDYALGGSDKVLMAVTPSSDEQTRPSRIAWMSWSVPGVWHPLWNAGTIAYIGCATPSSTHVACRSDGLDSAGAGIGLFRLKDSHVTWLNRTHPKACGLVTFTTKGTNLYALETSDKGVCTKGKLYRVQDDGKLVSGSKKYLFNATGGITTAYGKAVLSGGDQRHLYTTTGVTQKPVIIAKA